MTAPHHRQPSRRMVMGGTLGLGVGVGFIRQAGAQTHEAAISPVAARLMSAHDIPGLAIGVVTPDGASTYAFGLASRETGAPVTPETVFELGSISKVYTATLAALGFAKGRLNWSDPVSRHVPELAEVPIGAATLLDLGTYSAGGLPLQFPETVTDLAGAMAYFRDWRPIAGVGRVRQYSNPSVGLFGHAAAAAMGGDFETLLNRELLSELGLHQTHTRTPAGSMANYAWGHDRDGRSVRVNPGVFDMEAYGIKATVSDVLRFVSLHLAPPNGSTDLREALQQTRVPRLRVGAMIQSLGWEQYGSPLSAAGLLDGNSPAMMLRPQPAIAMVGDTGNSPRLFNKTGSTGGFGAFVAFVPESRVGVVILANRNFPIPARVEAAWQILSTLTELALTPDVAAVK